MQFPPFPRYLVTPIYIYIYIYYRYELRIPVKAVTEKLNAAKLSIKRLKSVYTSIYVV